MIWGMTLEPGKVYTRTVGEEVQLSLASLDTRMGAGPNSYCQVMMKTSKSEYVLCTLVHGIMFQQNLDLKLMPREKVTFSVQGPNAVYLIGYTPSSPDSDEEGELVQKDQTKGDNWQPTCSDVVMVIVDDNGATVTQPVDQMSPTNDQPASQSTDHMEGGFDGLQSGDGFEEEVSTTEVPSPQLMPFVNSSPTARKVRKVKKSSRPSAKVVVESQPATEDQDMPGIGHSPAKERKWSVADMASAAAAVKAKKMSVRVASQYYNVPKSTLQDRLKGRYAVDAKPGPRTTLSKAEEGAVVSWVIEMVGIGYEITRKNVQAKAKVILDESGKKTGFPDNRPGKSWWYGLLRRHPQLTTILKLDGGLSRGGRSRVSTDG